MIPIVASALVAGLVFAGPPEVEACAVREGDAPYWIDNASVIVRARAVEQRERRPVANPQIGIGTTVRFEVVETLKGTAPRFLEFDGAITDSTEFDENEPDIPRKWVRRGGRSGNCYALEYRAGKEYLLMLERSDAGLSPYWAAMGATNEHVEGPGDAWLRWVRDYLARKR